jgi:hypothetical protein
MKFSERTGKFQKGQGNFHQFSPVFTSLWAAVEVNAVQTKYDIYWGAIAGLKKSP